MRLGALRVAEQDFSYDLCSIRRYGARYKLVYHRHALRRGGLDRPREGLNGEGPPARCEGGGGAEGRFDSSLCRSRAAVFELAACNDWQYFCTFTLSDDRGFDRNDLGPWYKSFSQWQRNQGHLFGYSMAYLIVPEEHKNGAWHLHGMVSGLPAEKLIPFTLADHLPYKLLDKLKAGTAVYDWPAYRKKYGWCVLEPIRDRDRCASYIAKYVSKAFTASSLPPGAKMYYASQGLQRAQLVWRGRLHIPPGFAWDFLNEYVGIRWGEPADWLPEDELKEVFCSEKQGQ